MVDVTLRDREYVRVNNSSRALYVGDKAMLMLEEPMVYPTSSLVYSRRALPGSFEQSNSGKKPWSAPLREPA
eukprot:5091996-Amphidinium_carterae.1